jgi:membrane-associated phospholipid phosphatase
MQFLLFYDLTKNAKSFFSTQRVFALFLGALCTWICVRSGFDWWYYTHVHQSTFYPIFFPAVPIGGLVPLVVPLALYLVAIFTRKPKINIYAFALAQAALLGSLLSSLMKVFTGRVQPPHFTQTMLDQSNGFRFGLYEGGIFWGWPSSHTTIAFAMAFTLISILPAEQKAWKYLAVCYAFYVGIGVSMGIHWFSDFVMGAILGTIIGTLVGKSFHALVGK